MTKKEREMTLLSEMPLLKLCGYLEGLDLEQLKHVKEKFNELIDCLEVFALSHLHGYDSNKDIKSLGLYVHCRANSLFLHEKITLVEEFESKLKPKT